MARNDGRTPAKKIYGKPGTSYPKNDLAKPVVVERRTSGQMQTKRTMLAAHTDTVHYPSALLTSQGSDPGDNTDANFREEFRTLPDTPLTTDATGDHGIETTTEQDFAASGAASTMVDSSFLVKQSVLQATSATEKTKRTTLYPSNLALVISRDSKPDPETGIVVDIEKRFIDSSLARRGRSAPFAVSSIVAGLVTSGVAHEMVVGCAFTFETLTGPSGGVAISTRYFVASTPTATTFTAALTLGGAAQTGWAASAGTMTDGFREIQWLNTRQSIQINSMVDFGTLPSPITIPTTRSISLPSELAAVTGFFEKNSGSASNASATEIGAATHATIDGVPSVRIIDGFHGAAKAQTVRTWFKGVPLASVLPTPTIIRPSIGTITVKSKGEQHAGSEGQTYSQSLSMHAGTKASSIGPLLTNSVSAVNNPTDTTGAVASIGGISLGTICLGANASATISLDITASTPEHFASGDAIIHEVITEQRRLNLWKMEVTTVFVP